MASSLKGLRGLSRKELIFAYDHEAQSTQVGLNHYAAELQRRVMTKLTWAIAGMTAVMTVFTALNVWF